MNIITKGIFFLFLSIFATQLQAQSWELQKNENNIKVYYKKHSTHKHEIMVKTTIDANINDITKIIKDYKSMPKWVCRCEKVE